MTSPFDRRASGILAHLTSLPSPYGIGDIGVAAHAFLRFLHDAGQRLWQFLPTGPTNPVFDNSPYMSTSAFAGSPLLISLEMLVEDGLLGREQLLHSPEFSEYRTDYRQAAAFKLPLLAQAFSRFDRSDPEFLTFCQTCNWLNDYSLFMALKEVHQDAGWFEWPEEIAARNPDALAEQESLLAERIAYFRFEQYTFFRQWRRLREHAAKLNIRLIGDIPIYVGWDSADVWAHQSIFFLNPKTHRPTRVAGVPPDYFSETGQRWGNPLYRWNNRDQTIKNKLHDWWTERFRTVFELVDIARVDHFRGFEAYWSIPASHKTAMNGKWIKGPGIDLFRDVQSVLGPLDIIAEDLGEITQQVLDLRDALGFPGMKVLQFAFDGNRDNSFLPYNFTSPHSVIYTGTHDNDTTVGWFLSEKLDDAGRAAVKRFCNRTLDDGSEIHKDLIYLALSSTSRFAIFPLQDVLGFGNDCKMNSPGRDQGNWAWRCAPRFLTDDIAAWLRARCEQFGRCPAEEPAVPPPPSEHEEKIDV